MGVLNIYNITNFTKYIILILLGLSFATQSAAQYNYVIASDTTVITVERSINQEKIDDYRTTSVYNYKQNPEYENSVFRKLWFRFVRWMRSSLGKGGFSLLSDILYYGLMIGTAIGLIFIVLKSQGHNPFSRGERRTRTQLQADTIDENSSVESINKLIATAEEQGDYRLAIRLHFLKTLRLLDDDDHIVWRSGKTNHEYQTEIKDKLLKERFDSLSYVFEYCWYGQFEIENQSQYQQLREGYITLFNQIRR